MNKMNNDEEYMYKEATGGTEEYHEKISVMTAGARERIEFGVSAIPSGDTTRHMRKHARIEFGVSAIPSGDNTRHMRKYAGIPSGDTTRHMRKYPNSAYHPGRFLTDPRRRRGI
jgi:hypothetical protein